MQLRIPDVGHYTLVPDDVGQDATIAVLRVTTWGGEKALVTCLECEVGDAREYLHDQVEGVSNVEMWGVL